MLRASVARSALPACGPAPAEQEAEVGATPFAVDAEERHRGLRVARGDSDVEGTTQAPENAASDPATLHRIIVADGDAARAYFELAVDQGHPAPDIRPCLPRLPHLADPDTQLRGAALNRQAELVFLVGGTQRVDGDLDRPALLAESNFRTKLTLVLDRIPVVPFQHLLPEEEVHVTVGLRDRRRGPACHQHENEDAQNTGTLRLDHTISSIGSQR